MGEGLKKRLAHIEHIESVPSCEWCAVKDRGLNLTLFRQFDAMHPDDALPLLRTLLDAEPRAVAKLNALAVRVAV